MPEETDILELLEVAGVLSPRERPAQVIEIASRMHRTLDLTRQLIDAALQRGLVLKTENGVRLTEEGEALVRKHREEYVHRTYVHGRSLADRIRGVLEGRVTDWHGHWHRHGFDDESIHDFYRSMENLQGRIEDAVSLADLPQGEKCTVVLAAGGRGMVRRLAEMGLTPGTEVRVVRSAPMHGPIEVSVRGVSLALGRGIAVRVLVKRLRNSESSTNA
jgi:Fe2+ transport system protein FeoA/Mn-dependent DtxR family transcriptional regulator